MRTELGSSSPRNTSAELKLKLLTERMHQWVKGEIEGQPGSCKRNGNAQVRRESSRNLNFKLNLITPKPGFVSCMAVPMDTQ